MIHRLYLSYSEIPRRKWSWMLRPVRDEVETFVGAIDLAG